MHLLIITALAGALASGDPAALDAVRPAACPYSTQAQFLDEVGSRLDAAALELDDVRPVFSISSGAVSLGSYQAGRLHHWMNRRRAAFKVLRPMLAACSRKPWAADLAALMKPSSLGIHVAVGASAGAINSLVVSLEACRADDYVAPAQSLLYLTWTSVGFRHDSSALCARGMLETGDLPDAGCSDGGASTPADAGSLEERDGLFDVGQLEAVRRRLRAYLDPGMHPDGPWPTLTFREGCDIGMGHTLLRTKARTVTVKQPDGGTMGVGKTLTDRVFVHLSPGKDPQHLSLDQDERLIGKVRDPFITESGRYVRIRGGLDSLLMSYRAASAFPVAFPPVALAPLEEGTDDVCSGDYGVDGGCLYIDGGGLNNNPVDIALDRYELFKGYGVPRREIKAFGLVDSKPGLLTFPASQFERRVLGQQRRQTIMEQLIETGPPTDRSLDVETLEKKLPAPQPPAEDDHRLAPVFVFLDQNLTPFRSSPPKNPTSGTSFYATMQHYLSDGPDVVTSQQMVGAVQEALSRKLEFKVLARGSATTGEYMAAMTAFPDIRLRISDFLQGVLDTEVGVPAMGDPPPHLPQWQHEHREYIDEALRCVESGCARGATFSTPASEELEIKPLLVKLDAVPAILTALGDHGRERLLPHQTKDDLEHFHTLAKSRLGPDLYESIFMEPDGAEERLASYVAAQQSTDDIPSTVFAVAGPAAMTEVLPESGFDQLRLRTPRLGGFGSRLRLSLVSGPMIGAQLSLIGQGLPSRFAHLGPFQLGVRDYAAVRIGLTALDYDTPLYRPGMLTRFRFGSDLLAIDLFRAELFGVPGLLLGIGGVLATGDLAWRKAPRFGSAPYIAVDAFSRLVFMVRLDVYYWYPLSGLAEPWGVQDKSDYSVAALLGWRF